MLYSLVGRVGIEPTTICLKGTLKPIHRHPSLSTERIVMPKSLFVHPLVSVLICGLGYS